MSVPSEDVARTYLAEAEYWLADSVGKIKHCVDQLNDEQMWFRPQESMNSIANLLLHLCGNISQRILCTVGGEPDVRNRRQEFSERGPISKAELVRRLDAVAEKAAAILAEVSPTRLLEARCYRGLSREFDGTVLSVILHCLLHLSGHVQEIVCITRLQLGDDYEFQAV